jgi:hypothetical protein
VIYIFDLDQSKTDRQDLLLKFSHLKFVHLADFIKYVITIVYPLCVNFMTLICPYLCLKIFHVDIICKSLEVILCISENIILILLLDLKRLYQAFHDEVYYMSEAACVVCLPRKVSKYVCQFTNHDIICRCIISHNTENLWQSQMYKTIHGIAYLILDAKVGQNIRKCLYEIFP